LNPHLKETEAYVTGSLGEGTIKCALRNCELLDALAFTPHLALSRKGEGTGKTRERPPPWPPARSTGEDR